MAGELANQTNGGLQTGREQTRGDKFFRPNVDILESAEELMLKAEMPGSASDRISITYENDVLTLHGKVLERQPDVRYLLHEYGVGDFHRSFEINERIDPERICAEYADGVLTVHLPKAEAIRPKKIEVRSV